MVVANIQPLKWVMCTCWQLNAHFIRNTIHGIRFIRIERRNITPLTVFTRSNVPEILVFTDDLMRYKLFKIIIVRILCEIVWNRIECTGTLTVDFFLVLTGSKMVKRSFWHFWKGIFENCFASLQKSMAVFIIHSHLGGNWFLFIRLTTIWWLYLS